MSTHAASPPQPAPTLRSDRSIFNKERHIKYWLRCLKTHLPTAYTSNDAQRMTLAFFILSALDVLGVLHTKTTPAERKEYVEWILRCQHPSGGFRGFTGTMVGEDAAVEDCAWDPANLAATYFACAALAVLGEGMERVRTRECLNWVRGLQRENGSFGEGIGKGGRVEGGEDMRFCYCAAAVRWMLRRGDVETIADIDVERLVEYIETSVVSESCVWMWS
jgi:geranylgeranyl transferase type-1 subunit beta